MKQLVMATAAIAVLSAIFPAAAEVETFTVDASHTFPSFEVSHFGYSLQRGRFNKTSGKITLDAAAKAGSADITIDAGSVDTGLDKLEQHLRAEDFFDVANYPTITFKSTHFAFEGDKVKSASGELTMRGVTRPVVLSASHFNCAVHPMAKKKACGAEFTATVKRSDFGIKYGIPAVADDVLLRISVEALKD